MDKATPPIPPGPGDVDPLELFDAEDSSADGYAGHDGFESLTVAAAVPPPEPTYAPGDAWARDAFPVETPQAPSPVVQTPISTAHHTAAPSYTSVPRRPAAPVAVAREISTPTAWLQRNALSVAAVLVACLGSAAIVIGMRHRADTELEGWARSEAQAPAVLPARPNTGSSASASPDGARTPTDSNAEELTAAARPRTDGLTGATGTTAVGEDSARLALAAREANAREAARIAALATPPADTSRTAANAATPAPVATPFPNSRPLPGNGAVNTPPNTLANTNTAPANVPVVPASGASVANNSPLETPPAPARAAANTATPLPVASTPVVVPDPTPVLPSATPTPSAPPAAASPAPAAIVPPAVPTLAERRASVQQALNRYRDAYSSLNADAAKAVWPSVNAKQLGDAFAGLEQQNFQFANCSISFEAAQAKANCNGSASFVPRNGGGRQTQDRRWEFTLKEVNREWSIDRVVVR